MKTKSKALLLTLCAVLLVAASVLGTMAYLTSTDKVENTFTVGNVKITLDEAKVNPDGTLVAGADRVKANEYKLMPGHTYTKDPTVHVDANSEDSYIFVKVENGIADFEATSGVADDYLTITDQMKDKGWTPLESADGYGVYYKVYIKGAEGASNDLTVFEKFRIAGDANTRDGWGDISNAKIIVKAYAVQKDGFDTAEAAWTATSGTFTAGN